MWLSSLKTDINFFHYLLLLYSSGGKKKRIGIKKKNIFRFDLYSRTPRVSLWTFMFFSAMFLSLDG